MEQISNDGPSNEIDENFMGREILPNEHVTIEELKIDLFVDDLIEVINHALFPLMTKSILFDPENKSVEFKNIGYKQL